MGGPGYTRHKNKHTPTHQMIDVAVHNIAPACETKQFIHIHTHTHTNTRARGTRTLVQLPGAVADASSGHIPLWNKLHFHPWTSRVEPSRAREPVVRMLFS